MQYTATIGTHPKDEATASRLLQLLEVEMREGENDRGSFHAKHHDKEITITVQAADSVALRAILVSVTKILTVHEKIEQQ